MVNFEKKLIDDGREAQKILLFWLFTKNDFSIDA